MNDGDSYTGYDGDLEGMLSFTTRRISPPEPHDLLSYLRLVAALLAELPCVPGEPALIFRRGGKGVEARPIGEGVGIGRGKDCDVSFPELSEMSRHQFRITRTGARHILTDPESSNGTFVKGVASRITARELRSGDIIQAGGTTFVFILPEPDAPCERPDAPAGGECPPPVNSVEGDLEARDSVAGAGFPPPVTGIAKKSISRVRNRRLPPIPISGAHAPPSN